MNRCILLILACLMYSLHPLHAGERSLIDFDTEVIPILTKAGCNSGACHGAAAGRGEFYLSLYGSKPAADHTSIVHHLQGRRVNLSEPENSLLIAKPTEMIAHEGGTRFDLDSENVRILTDWIQQGAVRRNLRNVQSLTITPQRHISKPNETEVDIRIKATFDDQTQRDVTANTVFTAEDPLAIQLDPETGTATILRPGRHIVIARYLNYVEPIILIAPAGNEELDLLQFSRVNFIDEQIYQLLEVMRIPPSPQADDLTFLRRIQLDLTGRLPTPDEIRNFSKNQSPDKRQLLLDKILTSEEFNDYWTYEFSKLLRIRSQPQDSIGAKTYHDWLRNQIRERSSYAKIARDLLTATGDSHEYGPANFFRTVSGPREQAEFVSELFMGSRLRCANCHDHPLDHWTQDDYHGLAAIFTRIDSSRIVKLSNSGEAIHPASGEPALPRIPGEEFLELENDGRQRFSEWLTSSENEYFAKAIVNRIWKRLMGRGLVEPVDDLRTTNPATHPKLLELLAEDFVQHNYDLRHTIRTIISSAAYARSGQHIPANAADDRFYSRAIIKSLQPEVLIDAIADATGVDFQFGDAEQKLKAIQLFDSNISSPELDLLGRCSREESCESDIDSTGGLSLTLHLLNGGLLNKRITDNSGRLHQLLEMKITDHELIVKIYLATLSRFPRANEVEYWLHELEMTKTDEVRLSVAEDFFWSMLTSEEFQTNH